MQTANVPGFTHGQQVDFRSKTAGVGRGIIVFFNGDYVRVLCEDESFRLVLMTDLVPSNRVENNGQIYSGFGGQIPAWYSPDECDED